MSSFDNFDKEKFKKTSYSDRNEFNRNGNFVKKKFEKGSVFTRNFNKNNSNNNFNGFKQNFNQKNSFSNQQFSQSNGETNPQNRNFSYSNSNNENSKQKLQFRKPVLSFQTKLNPNKNDNNENKRQFFKQNNNSFFKSSFDKKNFSTFKRNNNNNDYYKKSTNIKIKLNNNNFKKDNDKQSLRKTSNTGGNVDKYSINSMLKTMSNNIELDTEIDDILGNVISVKLSGINSTNSLQKEKKIRKSVGNSTNKVKFNVPVVKEISVYNNKITLANLADQMSISVKSLINTIKKEKIDIDLDNNEDIDEIIIDGDSAELIVDCYGHKIKKISDHDAENEFIAKIKKSRTNLKTRPPIVTIMGHVDHGKTTLLDTIRKTSIASREAGGITQHIGAYRSKINDKWITFLDTPGHAAFAKMRARGAKVTDIVIIVVAADDGIMPQTEEAISHAKASNVPIIVAINKIDKPEANIEKTKQMLMQYELLPEEFGGDVIVVPISAKEGKNIDKLLEAILLQAEMLDLKASYDGTPEGFVIEAKMDKQRGTLATIIVKEGVLEQGDFIIVGEQYGKIKCMFDENRKMLKTAEPSVPVEILGLNAVPEAGDIFYAVKNEKEVKEILEQRKNEAKVNAQNAKLSSTTADLLSKLKNGEKETKKVQFIIKADTKGSLEAIVNTIEKINNNEAKPQVIHGGVGAVNESDVLLAQSCHGYIMTFNTQKADKKILEEAENKNVEIHDYKIIYELFDDIEDILIGKLKPAIKKIIQGHAEVKTIFEISKVGKILGCLVKDGAICVGSNVAVMRNDLSVFETKCNSLKHGKENIKDIQSGKECGIGLEKNEDIKPGDILEFFTIKEEKK